VTRTCCYTSFTYSYLARARILMQTLRHAQPDWDIWALVPDEPPPGTDGPALLAGFDGVLGLDDLAVPGVRSWLFGHDLIEACTALKAAAMLQLMDRGYDQVIYLDPDIAVFHPLAPALDAAGSASIVLTPHQAAPNWQPAVIEDCERASLRFGVFNMGFVAVRADAAGRAFASWWAAQVHAACLDAPDSGIFTDQKYADLVPCLFPGVAVLRDPGCNVASWNLSARRLCIGQDGGITADGAPLRFFHFSKAGGIGDAMIRRYAWDTAVPLELLAWYKDELARQTAVAMVPPGWWAYGQYADGTPVMPAARRLYRNRPDVSAYFPEPYGSGSGSLQEWLGAHEPDCLSAIPAATAVP